MVKPWQYKPAPPQRVSKPEPVDLTAWAESLILQHGRVSLIMDNYAVVGINDAEKLVFHREYSEALGEYAEVKVQEVVVETWGEKPQAENEREAA